MFGWRAVWMMAGFSWRRDWFGIGFISLFAVYIGWLLGMMLGDLLQERENYATPLAIMVDWLYLLMFPAFGQCMNRTSFRMIREDVFTRQIAHWRTMPIPLPAIILARLLRSLLFVPGFGMLFTLLEYGVSAEIRSMMPLGDWFAVTWIWICYGLAMNALLIWLELGLSGKMYALIYWCVMVVSGILAAILSMLGVHLVGETIDQVAAGHYGWLPAAALLSALSLIAGYRLTLRRMQRRAYHL